MSCHLFWDYSFFEIKIRVSLENISEGWRAFWPLRAVRSVLGCRNYLNYFIETEPGNTMTCRNRTISNFSSHLNIRSRYQVDFRKKQFQKNRYLTLERFLLFNLKFNNHLAVSKCIGAKDPAKAQCYLFSMGRKKAETFFHFIHSLFIAWFRDFTRKHVLALHDDIQKSNLCMPCQTLTLLLTFQSSITSCSDFWP